MLSIIYGILSAGAWGAADFIGGLASKRTSPYRVLFLAEIAGLIPFTALALLTGSIFPGVVLHIGNNAFAYLASVQQLPIAKMEWWAYLIATAVFAFCINIIYRNRTPYPDLRSH